MISSIVFILINILNQNIYRSPTALEGHDLIGIKTNTLKTIH